MEVGGLLLAKWARRNSDSRGGNTCLFSQASDERDNHPILLPEIALGGLLAG